MARRTVIYSKNYLQQNYLWQNYLPAHEVLRALEATAPKNKVEQMDFDALQEYNSPAVPSEVLEKLDALDVETLTPIEALNFLYELKKTLKGSLNG